MPKFVDGDNIYVGTDLIYGKAAIDAMVFPTPVYSEATLNAGKTIVTLYFDKPIFRAVATDVLLKAAVTVATDGTTFAALGASDTVAIASNTIVVTFNLALTLATNKLKVAADAVMNAVGVKNTLVTTAAIDAS